MLPDQMAKIRETRIQGTKARMKKHCSVLGEWTEECSSAHRMSAAALHVQPSRTKLECKTRLSKAGQSCLAAIQDVSNDWRQDTRPSAARNQNWKGPRIETVKPQKTRTTGLVEEAEEEVVEEAEEDVVVVEVAEVAVTLLVHLVRATPRLLGSEKKHGDRTEGKEEPGRWPELVFLDKSREDLIVRVFRERQCYSGSRKHQPVSVICIINPP